MTAIELMPVAQFPGARNWGYDGVHLYAPQHAYGGPDGLRRLVDAAHQHGLGVVLDVVYNHVGPEGNYLDRYGPYFTDVYRTPWGARGELRRAGQRRRAPLGARQRAVLDLASSTSTRCGSTRCTRSTTSARSPFLEELSDEVHELGRRLGRKVQLIAESDLNDPRLIRPPEHGGYGLDAQWADDVHHTIHVDAHRRAARLLPGLRGDRDDRRRATASRSSTRGATRRTATGCTARSSAGVPRQRFVVCAQNHDQVGNRPLGERLAVARPAERQRLAAALVLLSPYIPLLFMGEEYGETAPFLYFIEHGDPELVEAVRAGRRREFERSGCRPRRRSIRRRRRRSRAAKLDWDRRESASGALLLALYTRPARAAARGANPEARSERGARRGIGRLVHAAPIDAAAGRHLRRRARAAHAVVRVQPHGPAAGRARAGRSAVGMAAPALDRRADVRRRGAHDGDRAAGRAAAGDRRAEAAARRAAAVEHRARTVRLAPWSAAVYVRDFEDGSVT